WHFRTPTMRDISYTVKHASGKVFLEVRGTARRWDDKLAAAHARLHGTWKAEKLSLGEGQPYVAVKPGLDVTFAFSDTGAAVKLHSPILAQGARMALDRRIE